MDSLGTTAQGRMRQQLLNGEQDIDALNGGMNNQRPGPGGGKQMTYNQYQQLQQQQQQMYNPGGQLTNYDLMTPVNAVPAAGTSAAGGRRTSSITSQSTMNKFFKRKGGGGGAAFDDEAGIDIGDLTNNMSFDDLSHIRDRGPYAVSGSKTLDTTPFIPTLGPAGGFGQGKQMSNIQYRKQLNHQQKMNFANGARAQSLATGSNPMAPRQLTQPMMNDPRSMSMMNDPRSMSLNSFGPNNRAMSLNKMGGMGPRVMGPGGMPQGAMGPGGAYPSGPRTQSMRSTPMGGPPGPMPPMSGGMAGNYANNPRTMSLNAMSGPRTGSLTGNPMYRQNPPTQFQQPTGQYVNQQNQFQPPSNQHNQFQSNQQNQFQPFANQSNQYPNQSLQQPNKNFQPRTLAPNVYDQQPPQIAPQQQGSNDSLMNVVEEEEETTSVTPTIQLDGSRTLTRKAPPPLDDAVPSSLSNNALPSSSDSTSPSYNDSQEDVIYKFDDENHESPSISRKSTLKKSNSMRLRKLDLFNGSPNKTPMRSKLGNNIENKDYDISPSFNLKKASDRESMIKSDEEDYDELNHRIEHRSNMNSIGAHAGTNPSDSTIQTTRDVFVTALDLMSPNKKSPLKNQVVSEVNNNGPEEMGSQLTTAKDTSPSSNDYPQETSTSDQSYTTLKSRGSPVQESPYKPYGELSTSNQTSNKPRIKSLAANTAFSQLRNHSMSESLKSQSISSPKPPSTFNDSKTSFYSDSDEPSNPYNASASIFQLDKSTLSLSRDLNVTPPTANTSNDQGNQHIGVDDTIAQENIGQGNDYQESFEPLNSKQEFNEQEVASHRDIVQENNPSMNGRGSTLSYSSEQENIMPSYNDKQETPSLNDRGQSYKNQEDFSYNDLQKPTLPYNQEMPVSSYNLEPSNSYSRELPDAYSQETPNYSYNHQENLNSTYPQETPISPYHQKQSSINYTHIDKPIENVDFDPNYKLNHTKQLPSRPVSSDSFTKLNAHPVSQSNSVSRKEKTKSRNFSLTGKSKSFLKRLSKSSRRSSDIGYESNDDNSHRDSISISPSRRRLSSAPQAPQPQPLKFSKEELAIMTSNNDLLNELQLVTTELASSIKRELALENKLKGSGQNGSQLKSSSSNGYDSHDNVILEKLKIISELQEKVNTERRLRFISEEHALLMEHGQSPSPLKLNYEKNEMYKQLLYKNDMVNQLQDKLDEMTSKQKTYNEGDENVLDKYNELVKENSNLKFNVVPGLERQINELSLSANSGNLNKQFALQNTSYSGEETSATDHDGSEVESELKLEINALKSQRDELREVISKLMSSQQYEAKLAQDKIKNLETKLKDVKSINDKLSKRIDANNRSTDINENNYSFQNHGLGVGGRLQGFTIVSPNRRVLD